MREQLPQVKEHLAQFGDKLPDALAQQLEALEARLAVGVAPTGWLGEPGHPPVELGRTRPPCAGA